MDKRSFDEFFKPYAENVDNADTHAFWRLSDALIERIITDCIPLDLSPDATIMDAGGGTARWAIRLAQKYASDFLVYDRSPDMLAQAQRNVEDSGLRERITLLEGDLSNMENLDDASVDHVVSIYSPLSFIYNPQDAARELYRVLRPGGSMLIMAHSHYNALASKINNYTAPADELTDLNTNARVHWAPHVPELVTYSQESMRALLEGAGFSSVATYGVPVFVQPGPEDFDPTNTQKSRISAALEDESVFSAVFDLEMEHNAKPEVVNRGMNIFAHVKKPRA